MAKPETETRLNDNPTEIGTWQLNLKNNRFAIVINSSPKKPDSRWWITETCNSVLKVKNGEVFCSHCDKKGCLVRDAILTKRIRVPQGCF